MFDRLPPEILMMINDHLPSKDKVQACANRFLHSLFQPEIGKPEAKEAAEYAIDPIKKNVEKFETLLKECPALLSHPMTVTNRHGQVIKGTVHHLALHEGDDELIDVMKPAFARLQEGSKTMEAQRQAWLCEGWMEAEEKACASACEAIDKVFIAFNNASDPNDVTELPQYPFTITINHQGANEALETFRKAIDALYTPTNEVIISGRDPSIRLLERVITQYVENYSAFGEYNTPRNNAMMRQVFAYVLRYAPVNFMQAFAQGFFDVAMKKEKLTRSLEYSEWPEHFILPVDSDPLLRLGYEYFTSGVIAVAFDAGCVMDGTIKKFLSDKNQLYSPELCNPVKVITQ